MMENTVKKTLNRGGVAIGTSLFEFNTTGVARIAANAGADFLFYDTEHTGWSVEGLRAQMAIARGAGIVPFARVPATQYHLIARVLDVGAMGIMIPMVESDEQARLLVRAAKYPPDGGRGAAFGVAHDDYEPGEVAVKMKTANENVLLICLIETVAGVDNVGAIAAVDGIDVLWIGHFDLTNSMGIPAQFTHPRYLQAVDAVLEACARHGKAAGFMAADVEAGRRVLAQGFRCVSYSGDIWLYSQALKSGVGALKEAAASGQRTRGAPWEHAR
jgi:2-dehydro-3-deoxyglucarate aldolase/4-hydroxy-2-oxoheptanedioate aldolase